VVVGGCSVLQCVLQCALQCAAVCFNPFSPVLDTDKIYR